MTARQFAAFDFVHVGPIEVERGPYGHIGEFTSQSRYPDAETAPLHAYGAGPFCRFEIAQRRNEAGLDILTLDGHPVYAGECENLAKRLGPSGYGAISSRSCFKGGQPANCRVNASVLSAARAGQVIDLWFRPMSCSVADRRGAETQQIRSLSPAWNKSKSATSTV